MISFSNIVTCAFAATGAGECWYATHSVRLRLTVLDVTKALYRLQPRAPELEDEKPVRTQRMISQPVGSKFVPVRSLRNVELVIFERPWSATTAVTVK